jgi:hypothetical protein
MTHIFIILARKKGDTELGKLRESTLNPYVEKTRLSLLKNVALKNISDDFDGRKNLDLIGIQSIPEKSTQLKYNGRKLAIGETLVLKLKVKNVLFVSEKKLIF